MRSRVSDKVRVPIATGLNFSAVKSFFRGIVQLRILFKNTSPGWNLKMSCLGNVPYFWTSGRLCDFDGCDRPDFFPKNINGWFWSANQVTRYKFLSQSEQAVVYQYLPASLSSSPMQSYQLVISASEEIIRHTKMFQFLIGGSGFHLFTERARI